VKNAQLLDGKIIATLENPERDNPNLIRLLVDLGVDIQFVGELRRSLEDVYLQLVKNA
jgi:ABC-2 type transport system ATP-binding protein